MINLFITNILINNDYLFSNKKTQIAFLKIK